MDKTEKYHLPQWEMSDRILMEDFNQMCRDIEEGIESAKTEAKSGDAALAENLGSIGRNLRIETGQYTGDGQWGNVPNTLTFSLYPLLVYVSKVSPARYCIFTKDAGPQVFGSQGSYVNFNWSEDGHKLSWAAPSNLGAAYDQLNEEGCGYIWFAIGYDDSAQ